MQSNPDINSANNKVVGHNFDNAGNTTVDAEGRTFFYDAENKQKEVRDASNNIIGQYLYDGDGKRVKKIAANDTTIFVYDAGGKLASEYQVSASQSQAPTTSYLTNDTLGSPRVTTDASGNVVSRRDFRPYGEEIYRAGQGTDKVRQKFTSYERDNESGLDFAKDRMFGSSIGRFTQVDSYNIIFEKEKGKDEKEKQHIFLIYISQPQIWNKYVYSVNNPLKFTDPDGRRPLTAQEQENLKKFRESGYAYSVEQLDGGHMTAEQAEAFRHSVDAASQVIENTILAVPTGQSDPRNLRVVLWALDQIGDRRYAANSSNGGADLTYNSGRWNIWAAKDNVKCNFFVAMAYINAKGGNIGLQTFRNPDGFQNSTSIRWSAIGTLPGGSHKAWTNIPNAQQISGGMTNFTVTNSPGLGDIVAGPSGDSYHAGIQISGNVVISANTDNGVRVGSFSGTYLRYKP